MKASVVLPVHNKAPWLRPCLESLFAQTMADFEVIAVDDASTDASPALLRSCTDPRLRIVRLERNSGPGMAAQRGMDEARAPLILRVDADDVLEPDRFARQLAFFDAHPEVGVLGTAIRLLDEPAVVRTNPATDADAKANLLFGVAVFQPTMALRTTLVKDHGLRYEGSWPRYGEDWLFQCRAFHLTRFANLPQPLVRYREGPQNTAQGRNRPEDLRMLLRTLLPMLGLPPPTEADLEAHLMAVKVFVRKPHRDGIVNFKRRLRELERWNRSAAVFDERALERRLQRAWDELLHHLPAHGAGAVRAYLCAGARLTPARAYYLLRALLPTVFNRPPA